MTNLEEGVYNIPMDKTYHISGRVLTIKNKSDRWRKEGDYRCVDCALRSIGRCTKNSQNETWICSVKPKGDGVFYNAPDHSGKNCKLIILKDGKKR